MKTLVVCRHAKSSWKYPVRDIYRPLNARGISQAPKMANTCDVAPDKVLCSPAVRAWSTALSYFNELNWDYSVLQMAPGLYEASAQSILSLLKQQDEAIGVLFLFGHNPGFNELVDSLISGDLVTENIVTSARVTMNLNINKWRDIEPGCGHIVHWQVPLKSAH